MEYLSKQRYDEIASELDHLISVVYPEVRETVAETSAQGDRSENAGYREARRRQAKTISRIRFLQRVLENSRVIDPAALPKDRVCLLSRVEFTDLATNTRMKFEIVSPHEMNLEAGKISLKSPIGAALMGKKVGETAEKWLIAKDEATGTYTLQNTNTDSRYLSYNGTGFKAYAAANDARVIELLIVPAIENDNSNECENCVDSEEDQDHNCDTCGKVNVTEHSYSTVVTAPTCTEDGYTTYTCACGDSYTVSIPVVPHTEELIPAIEATCTSFGVTAGSKCSVCGSFIDIPQGIPPKPHTPIPLKAKAATCTADGSYDNVVYCTECKVELSRETTTVDALGHTEETIAAKAPTCTEIGWDAYQTCEKCD